MGIINPTRIYSGLEANSENDDNLINISLSNISKNQETTSPSFNFTPSGEKATLSKEELAEIFQMLLETNF